MLRFILIALLILITPLCPKAAGIYDGSLMAIDKKKKDALDIIKKTADVHVLSENLDRTTFEYDTELKLILKKNNVTHTLQGKKATDQGGVMDVASRSLVQMASNDDIDVQAFLETQTVWIQIKADLKNANNFLDTFERWTTSLFEKYLGENINANLVLVTNIQAMNQLRDRSNFQEKKPLSSLIFQTDTFMKGEVYPYKTSADNPLANPANDQNGGYGSGDDKENALSVIYLWKMYSDIIIAVSVMAGLWLAIASLIKLLAHSSQGRY